MVKHKFHECRIQISPQIRSTLSIAEGALSQAEGAEAYLTEKDPTPLA